MDICKGLLLFALVVSQAAMAQLETKQDLFVTEKAMTAEQIAANDSILREAKILYGMEWVSWHSTDFLNAQGLEKKSGGYVVYQENQALTAIYFDKKKRNVILEYKYDIPTKKVYTSLEQRVLTEQETRLIKEKEKMLNMVLQKEKKKLDLYYPIIYNFCGGNYNYDVLYQENGNVRLYILAGTGRNDIVPMGADYVADFNAKGKLVSFRNLHEGLITQQMAEYGVPIHSHVEGNSYITTSDICTFMLYGHDAHGLNDFAVLSIDHDCIYRFNAKEFSIKSYYFLPELMTSDNGSIMGEQNETNETPIYLLNGQEVTEADLATMPADTIAYCDIITAEEMRGNYLAKEKGRGGMVIIYTKDYPEVAYVKGGAVWHGQLIPWNFEAAKPAKPIVNGKPMDLAKGGLKYLQSCLRNGISKKGLWLNVIFAIDKEGLVQGISIPQNIKETGVSDEIISLLQTLNFTPALDTDGNPIDVYMELTVK